MHGGTLMDPMDDLGSESTALGLLSASSSSSSSGPSNAVSGGSAPSGVSLSHRPIRNDKKHLSRSATSLSELVSFLSELSPRLEVVASDAVKEHAYWRRMAEAFFLEEH
jgi:hypothetical protein